MKRRVFIAINLPEETKKNIGNIIKKLAYREVGIRWVKPENIHLTLAFLDKITDKQVVKLAAMLRQISKNQKKFKLTLKNIGFFPSTGSPRIIWIGCGENFNLLNLQNNLTKHLKINGFRVDRRPSVPHLTIGRVKRDIGDTKGLFDTAKDIKLEDILVSGIDIMESFLGKEGAEYKVIFRINLKENL